MVIRKMCKFQYADSWLLLSIIYADIDGKSDLSTIIGCGDFINHAIFTYQELQGGMYRLMREGYVYKNKNLYLPSQQIRDLYADFSRKNKIILKQLEFIRQLLDAPKWSSDYKPEESNHNGICKEITKSVVDRAYKKYCKKIGFLDDDVSKK